MDYERVHKPLTPQVGGFSPKKLRAMLLGAERRRKEEEELESKTSLRSELSEFEDRRASAADSFKDVECSTPTEMASGHRSRDHAMGDPRVKCQEEDSYESESASSGFEFQKAERPPAHRLTAAAAFVPPFSKPAPSKWDDAQKWIASPTTNRGGSKAGGGQTKKGGLAGRMSRHAAAKVVLDVEEVDTKRVDGCQASKKAGDMKSVNWLTEPCPVPDSGMKLGIAVENSVVDSAVNLSWHDSSTSLQSATSFMMPAPTVRSVSMRDMGTEMTPIASQEPSRTGTPVGATSPICSPPSSRPPTPQTTAPVSTQTDSADCHEDFNKKKLSEKELQRDTRREILVLGQQLGKTNITAWAGKDEEEINASNSTKNVSEDQPAISVVEARATAWEESEKAKYLARFRREEIKIQAWENHQKATIEAEMRKIEVEVERMRASAHEKLMNQLAAVRHKAEEKRATAEAKRNHQAARIARQADYIRRTGRIPSSFSCWSWCS
ncbi:hypothetical protein OPV22_007123 [Ensete ventricosum]|uniref:Remorin C-terminal domain-containing protein n=1 Tax=Ensete ventricosum TaxID=4639 RepID=A0AAV8RMV1_ENSVE|nr:hypothetical protein OPV22_007123 [Ensete ventricosum]